MVWPWVSLSVWPWTPLLVCFSLPSFSRLSPRLCLPSLSRSHTLNAHNKHTTSLLTSAQIVRPSPHKRHSSITTTVLARRTTPATLTQTYTERNPLSPKQHAPKYSWESHKSYKASMCGQHQALNLGSGAVATMSQLWFSRSLILSSDFDYFSSPSFVFLHGLSLKEPLNANSTSWLGPDHHQGLGLRCINADPNACSDSSDCQQSLSCACETPASVYFHLQG